MVSIKSRPLLCFIFAIIICVGVGKIILGIPLHTSTDVIGFPVHQNFNINKWFHLYYLVAFGLPVLTILLLEWRSGFLRLPISSIGPVQQTKDRVPLGVHLLFIAMIIFLSADPSRPLKAPWDTFHDGEKLVTANFLLHGKFPFRDFIFVHGLWAHPLRTWISFALFEHSRWGFLLAEGLVWIPLFYVGQYIVLALVLGRNQVYVALTSLAVPILFPQLFDHPDVRMIFYPWILLGFSLALKKDSRALFGCLGLALGVHFVIIPESAFWCVALVIACALYDVQHRSRTFPRVLFLIAGMSFIGVGWSTFLFAHHALGDYLDFFRNFAVDHRFGSGLTGQYVVEHGVSHIIAFLVPPFVLMCMVFRYWLFFKKRKRWNHHEVIVFSIAIFSAFFYQKALSRLDHHVFQSFVPIAPLMWLIVSDALKQMPWPKFRFKQRTARFVGVGVATVILFVCPKPIESRATGFLAKWAVRSQDRERMPENVKIAIRDFTRLANLLKLGPHDLYDFTNHSLIFYDLLDFEPLTRFHYVNYAMHVWTQEAIVKDLKRVHPKLVVFNNDDWTDEMDGVPNMVRHHLVSRFILAHYRPLSKLDSYTIYARNDMTVSTGPSFAKLFEGPTDNQNMYWDGGCCDWGFAPQHMTKQWIQYEKNRTEIPLSLILESPSSFRFHIPESIRTQAAYIELQLRQSVQGEWELFEVNPDAKWDRERTITFQTSSHTPTTLWIPVSSCSQWWAKYSDQFIISGAHIDKIKKLSLILPVEPHK